MYILHGERIELVQRITKKKVGVHSFKLQTENKHKKIPKKIKNTSRSTRTKKREKHAPPRHHTSSSSKAPDPHKNHRQRSENNQKRGKAGGATGLCVPCSVPPNALLLHNRWGANKYFMKSALPRMVSLHCVRTTPKKGLPCGRPGVRLEK